MARDWATAYPAGQERRGEDVQFCCANRGEVDALVRGLIAGYRMACRKMRAATVEVMPAWLMNEDVDTEDVDQNPDLTPDIHFRIDEAE